LNPSPLLSRASATTPSADRARQVLTQLVFPFVVVLALWIAATALRKTGLGNDLVRVVASLLQAWILIRLFSTLVRDPLLSKLFSYVAWIIAALNILRLLNPVITILENFALAIGDTRLSLYTVIKGILLLSLLLWAVSFISNVSKARLAKSKSLTPSVQTLISQAIRILLLFFSIMVAMSAVGINLTALHVLSGAIGVGIGFGLQSIFSNLMAGIIILIEGTIKVGDFVELESGVVGEVREIDIRSTRVTTNDNVDILVPNAEFINNRVTNWTLRDAYRRTRIPFGVAYGTDKDLVKKAALEAAASQPHVLTGPDSKPSQVWLVGFGDTSLNFELVVWLSPEAVKRPGAVMADYNWALDTALNKYGIEIPFPQRDIRIRAGAFSETSAQ
jgi:potassium efflux system protein